MSVRENRLADANLVQPKDYRVLLRSGGKGWVAEVEGRIVGFAIADISRSNIWALFVNPLAERRGVGRVLHDKMMEGLFADGAEHVWLRTEPDTRAEGFYRAAGWRYIGREQGEARYEISREDWFGRSSALDERG